MNIIIETVPDPWDRADCPKRYTARMFDAKSRMVAYVRLMGTSSNPADGVTICDIETDPDLRRTGLARDLLNHVRSELGDVKTTGSCSRSGHSLLSALDVQLAPGGEFIICNKDEYSFVDWSTGEFK